MPRSYTPNLGIIKPADGEEDGVWGELVNDNMDILDVAINGVLSLSLSGTSSTLTTSDGLVSNGQYRLLVLGGTPSGTHTITISPNDADKVYFVNNTTAQSVVFTQGSGGNVTIATGDSAVIYANGAGAGAAVENLTDHFAMSSVKITGGSITGITDLAIADGGTGASTAANALLNFGLTATAAELNTLDGITATTAELNYTDGVTSNIQTQLDAKAPLASPALTGTPTAPTAAVGTNTTQVATTAFVNAEIANDAPTKTGTGASGTWSISVTGNAGTATQLATSRSINGVAFNGTADINVPDIRASNGTVLLDGTGVTSAVNYATLTNAATGGTVSLSTAGSDTNIPFAITTKGTGAVTVSTVGGAINMRPGTSGLRIWDDSDVYYHNVATGTLTANRTLTLPNASVTLVSGTMVPTTGTGATGTWGISISGNAATATTLTGLTPTITELNYTNGVTSAIQTQLNAKAALASPAFTGTPTAPTAAAATDTTQIATTAFVRDAIPNVLHASGSAPVYACRAWVNFDGTGVVDIRASGNVSSITDNGTGNYTVNFATGMPDANYCALVTSVPKNATNNINYAYGLYPGGTKTASAVQIAVGGASNATGFTVDWDQVNVAVFR